MATATHSSYWMDNRTWATAPREEGGVDVSKAMRLAATRRAIANFVSIVSNKNVPVHFYGDESATDGKSVVIAADDNAKNFDVMVGLALHEGAHILLSPALFRWLQVLRVAAYSTNPRAYPDRRVPIEADENTFTTQFIELDVPEGTTLAEQIYHPEVLAYAKKRLADQFETTGDRTGPPGYPGAYMRFELERHNANIHNIMNILEDRRIDKWVYGRAVGYRPYYSALYEKYLFTNNTSKWLRVTPEARIPTFQNYIDHLLLMIHPDSDPQALPGLQHIFDLVDLSNIERLGPEHDPVLDYGSITYETTPTMWRVAQEIYVTVIKYVELYKELEKQEQEQQGASDQQGDNSESSESGGEGQEASGGEEGQDGAGGEDQQEQPQAVEGESDRLTPSPAPGLDRPDPRDPSAQEGTGDQEDAGDQGDAGDQEGTGDGEQDGESDTGGDNDGEDGKGTQASGKGHEGKQTSSDDPSSPSDMEPRSPQEHRNKNDAKINESATQKDLAKIRDLSQGEVRKKKITKQMVAAVGAMEEADAKLVTIQDKINCLITRNVSQKLMEEGWFIFSVGWKVESNMETRMESLRAGRRMGQVIHQRLQIRNDPMVTKQIRLPSGKIERRLLAGLGAGQSDVFFRQRVDKHRPVMLHLTIDGSGSMTGKKIEKVMSVATAMAYLSSKMENVDCVISIRGGIDYPIIAVLFDSRRDTFQKWMKFAPFIHEAGATPEGLCFEATMDMILESSNTHDVYFINFSDGQPGFRAVKDSTIGSRKKNKMGAETIPYGGETAWKHTRKMINQIRERGIKVLAYYIDDADAKNQWLRGTEADRKAFRYMYGNDASFVDVEKATDVLRTLNALLASR